MFFPGFEEFLAPPEIQIRSDAFAAAKRGDTPLA
jgi:hypothetical protein